MSIPRSNVLATNYQLPNKVKVQEKPPEVKYPAISSSEEANPYKELKLPDSSEEFHNMLLERDRIIEAMNLIISIIRHDPLIVDDHVVPNRDVLLDVVKLLTNAEEVEFIEKIDKNDGGCCCSSSDNCLNIVEKIFIKIGGQVYNLKYTFPNVIMKLEEFKISYKIVKTNQ